MKKIFALGLIAALSLALFAGCNGGNNDDPNKNKNNTEPTITGVQDTATVMAGTEFNALEGVTATDKEDGDLTSKITVESEPALTFTSGKATPAATGTYEIIYSVKDSGGLEGNAYCTLTVTPAAGEETTLKEYKDFNVADKTLTSDKDDEGTDYWKPHIDTAEATAKLSKGALVFDVTNRNDAGDGAITLTRTMNDLTKGKYTFMIWAKSSVKTYVNMIALDKKQEGWHPVSDGAYNKPLGTELTVLKHEYTIDDSNNTSSVEFRLHMGRDGSAPEDMPNVYTISIYKVAIYQTTGQNKTTELYTSDFTNPASNVTLDNQGDGANVSVAHDAAKKLSRSPLRSTIPMAAFGASLPRSLSRAQRSKPKRSTAMSSCSKRRPQFPNFKSSSRTRAAETAITANSKKPPSARRIRRSAANSSPNSARRSPRSSCKWARTAVSPPWRATSF